MLDAPKLKRDHTISGHTSEGDAYNCSVSSFVLLAPSARHTASRIALLWIADRPQKQGGPMLSGEAVVAIWGSIDPEVRDQSYGPEAE